ncbi:response regulator [Pedobacter sp. SD-b]|uniref:Response regulator n=1 Tax=Pedobacter segetis TaxID=2793069 RepID=A0ABS1BNM0_9SPHI|nr:response regulator [Pedobacter segetis]MBK0384487.1 response regulator [Pedobacter segetis]
MNQKKAILIVDDDPRNIFALKMVLKARGFECETATTFVEALEVLKSKKNIHLILMDMMMPDVDGYESIEKIKTSGEFNNVPIIAVTAQAMAGDKEKCLEAGADGYVSKPVNIDHLLVFTDKFL